MVVSTTPPAAHAGMSDAEVRALVDWQETNGLTSPAEFDSHAQQFEEAFHAALKEMVATGQMGTCQRVEEALVDGAPVTCVTDPSGAAGHLLAVAVQYDPTEPATGQPVSLKVWRFQTNHAGARTVLRDVDATLAWLDPAGLARLCTELMAAERPTELAG